MDVFISYSRKDRAEKDAAGMDVISRIQQAFQEAGISYWLDEEGIHSGETFASVISRNIADSKVFLFVSSANSNASRWTCGEIATASSYDKRIIPFRIDAAPYDPSVTIYLAALDTIEYPSNPDKAIRRLVKSVQMYLEELEAEARRVEEEKRMLAEKKRLEAERERIRLENAKVIAGLTVRQTELEGKIHAIDTRIDSFLDEKNQLLSRLTAIRMRSAELQDEKLLEAQLHNGALAGVSVKENLPEQKPASAKPKRRLPLWLSIAFILMLAGGLALGLNLRNRHGQRGNATPPPQSMAEIDTTLLVQLDTVATEVAVADTTSVAKAAPQEPKVAEAISNPNQPVIEKPKQVLTIDGKEGDFSFQITSDKEGSVDFPVLPALRVSVVEKPDWCTCATKKGHLEVRWAENDSDVREGRILIKSGKEERTITIRQVAAQSVIQAYEIRKGEEELRKQREADSIAQEEARKKEQEKTPVAKTIFESEVAPIVVFWNEQNGYWIMKNCVTVAQWKAIMGKRINPEKDYVTKFFDPEDDELSRFMQNLSKKTKKQCVSVPEGRGVKIKMYED